MTAYPDLDVFTNRPVMTVEATLRRPTTGTRFVTVAIVPLEGETVAQFAARVMQTHCDSITKIKKAVIELRVVAEGEAINVR